jgi:hypothetical protein
VAWLKEIGIVNISMEAKKFDNVVEEAKTILAEDGGTGFPNICLYNSLVATGNAKEGIEALMKIYGNLLGLHG